MNDDVNNVPNEQEGEELDNIIVLNDENGEEIEFEFLDLIEYEGEEEAYEPIFQLNEYLKARELLFSKATIEDSHLSSYLLRVEITTTSNQEITLETGFEKIEK